MPETKVDVGRTFQVGETVCTGAKETERSMGSLGNK